MTKIRVRGVHATAATRLLLNAGYDVVEASETLTDRFDASFGDGAPDAHVRSSDDGLGVYVTGDSAEEVADGLALGDTFVFAAVAVGAVRDATVEETVGSGAFVEFDDGHGFLPFSKVDDHIDEGDELRVTVTEEAPPWSDGSPVVAGGERVTSDDGLVTLVRGASGARVEGGTAQDATQLTRSMATLGVEPPDGWGTVYSSEAVAAELGDVSAAIKDAADRIGDTAEEARWLYLGRKARAAYDEVRAEVTPTVAGHHRLKATGRGAAAGADVAENVVADEGHDGLIGDGVPLDALRRRFGPREGDRLEIVHAKPDGRFPSLGRGEVVETEGDEVVVKRVMSSSGTYDALGVEREEGDTARTRFEEGARAYPTVYYGDEGDKKGTYVNVCTPLELFPDSVRYVDLYIDVVEVEGEVRTVDADELDAAVADGKVPESVAEEAREVAENVEESL